MSDSEMKDRFYSELCAHDNNIGNLFRKLDVIKTAQQIKNLNFTNDNLEFRVLRLNAKIQHIVGHPNCTVVEPLNKVLLSTANEFNRQIARNLVNIGRALDAARSNTNLPVHIAVKLEKKEKKCKSQSKQTAGAEVESDHAKNIKKKQKKKKNEVQKVKKEKTRQTMEEKLKKRQTAGRNQLNRWTFDIKFTDKTWDAVKRYSGPRALMAKFTQTIKKEWTNTQCIDAFKIFIKV